jgi:hypothetical protein
METRVVAYAQQSSYTCHSHPIEIYTSSQIIQFACYTSVYEPIFTGDSLIFTNNISPNEILGQTT